MKTFTKATVLKAVSKIHPSIELVHDDECGEYRTDFWLEEDSELVFGNSGGKGMCFPTLFVNPTQPKSEYWEAVYAEIQDGFIECGKV